MASLALRSTSKQLPWRYMGEQWPAGTWSVLLELNVVAACVQIFLQPLVGRCDRKNIFDASIIDKTTISIVSTPLGETPLDMRENSMRVSLNFLRKL